MMLLSALARCVFFVLFLGQNSVKGRTVLESKNPQKIPPTPQLLLTSSSTTTPAVEVEPGKLLTDTISQKVICGNLRNFRKTVRKLFSESCKTDSSKGKRNKKERLLEDCVPLTKDRMIPCIKDGLLNEECMEAVLNVSRIKVLFGFPLHFLFFRDEMLLPRSVFARVLKRFVEKCERHISRSAQRKSRQTDPLAS